MCSERGAAAGAAAGPRAKYSPPPQPQSAGDVHAASLARRERAAAGGAADFAFSPAFAGAAASYDARGRTPAPVPPPTALYRDNARSRTYRVISFLGSGTFARVFAVQEEGSEAVFAMKVVRKTSAAYRRSDGSPGPVLVERAALARMAPHPNLMRCAGAFSSEGEFCMLFDHVPGGLTVASFVERYCRRGLLAVTGGGRSFRGAGIAMHPEESDGGWRLLSFFAADLMAILAALRERGVAHRDIKPENILVTPEGRLILSDFDSAVFFRDGGTAAAAPEAAPEAAPRTTPTPAEAAMPAAPASASPPHPASPLPAQAPALPSPASASPPGKPCAAPSSSEVRRRLSSAESRVSVSTEASSGVDALPAGGKSLVAAKGQQVAEYTAAAAGTAAAGGTDAAGTAAAGGVAVPGGASASVAVSSSQRLEQARRRDLAGTVNYMAPERLARTLPFLRLAQKSFERISRTWQEAQRRLPAVPPTSVKRAALAQLDAAEAVFPFADADAAGDLWAVGCVLAYLAYGLNPFERASAAETIAGVLLDAAHEVGGGACPPSELVPPPSTPSLAAAVEAGVKLADFQLSGVAVAPPREAQAATPGTHSAAASDLSPASVPSEFLAPCCAYPAEKGSRTEGHRPTPGGKEVATPPALRPLLETVGAPACFRRLVAGLLQYHPVARLAASRPEAVAPLFPGEEGGPAAPGSLFAVSLAAAAAADVPRPHPTEMLVKLRAMDCALELTPDVGESFAPVPGGGAIYDGEEEIAIM